MTSPSPYRMTPDQMGRGPRTDAEPGPVLPSVPEHLAADGAGRLDQQPGEEQFHLQFLFRDADFDAVEYDTAPLGKHPALYLVPTFTEEGEKALIVDSTGYTPATLRDLLTLTLDALGTGIDTGIIDPDHVGDQVPDAAQG